LLSCEGKLLLLYGRMVVVVVVVFGGQVLGSLLQCLRFEREKRERTGVCELLLVFVWPSVLQANNREEKRRRDGYGDYWSFSS
jgi:hypothetical protein